MTAPIAEVVDREEIDFEKDTLVEFSDGRKFHMSEGTTSSQDMWVMTRLDRAGLEAISAANNTPEKLDSLAIQLVEAAYEAGTLYEIIAGMYVEKGIKWTRERAYANAQYFADMTDREDKQKFQGSVASILLMYFVSGLVSRATSLKSSEAEGSQAGPEVSVEPPSSATPSPGSSSPIASSSNVPSDVLAALRAAGSTVVTGTPSPEKSQDTTTGDSTPS